MSNDASLEIDTVGDAPPDATSRQSAFLASHPDRTIGTILVLIAMESEALPVVEGLGLSEEVPSPLPKQVPGRAWSGTISGPSGAAKVHVVQSGKCKTHGVDLVGTVPAAVAAFSALSSFSPDLVVSAGTAGGFSSRGAAVGDIFVSSATINHDRRIPIPGFDAYGDGSIPSLPTPALLRTFVGEGASEGATAPLRLRPAIVSSGNSLDATPEDLAKISSHGAAVKEMEAAAVAWAAELFETPLLGIKAITDVVDGDRPTNEEFLENLGLAVDALKGAVPQILRFLAGKKYSEA